MSVEETASDFGRLLDACRRDVAAQGELLLRYRSWLQLLARVQIDRGLQGKLDSSDAAQQVLLEACRTFPQFRGTTQAELTAWLRQILVHVLAHEARRYAGTQQRAIDREVSLEQQLAESSQRLASGPPADSARKPARPRRHEEELRLAEVLARLPEDYREVIVLRNLQGLSHEEVAERMGRSAGAVRMLWVRALSRLRRELGQGSDLT